MLAAGCLSRETPKWVAVHFVYPNSEGSGETDSPEPSLLDNAISTKFHFRVHLWFPNTSTKKRIVDEAYGDSGFLSDSDIGHISRNLSSRTINSYHPYSIAMQTL